MSHGRIHSRRFCCYKGCSSDLLKTRDGAISFFSFPIKDTERCSAWITNCGREEFRYLTPRELADKRICELHFNDSMFSNFFKTNLKKNAIPNSWEKIVPELIEIDDDDCEGSQPENCLADINETDTPPLSAESILSSVLLNGNHSSSEVLSYNQTSKSPVANEQSPSISSTNYVKSGEKNSNGVVSKTYLPNKKNTKFHNLPPETTQTDFYFQHCPEVIDETNTNSMPEPPDGELPLFVQQDSVISLMDEHAMESVMEPPTKRRRRSRDDDDIPYQMRDAVKHLRNITSTLANNEDEFDIFGRSVAVQLKKMSLCTALSVQAKIQNLLSQHRISDIERETEESRVRNKSPEKQVEEHQIEEKNENRSSEKEEVENAASPQLSLDCASEHSENEMGH